MSQKTYRIGEAAAKLNLKSYVLRFWETEFPQIAPLRTEKGQRLYTESDIAVLGRIRYLLHERGLTIDGARRQLREEAARGTVYTTPDFPVVADDADIADVADTADDDPDDGFGEDSPNDSPETFTDTPAAAPHAAAPDTLADAAPAGETAACGNTAREQMQASLFSPENSGIKQTELRGVITELETIRRLLVFDGEIS